MNFGRALREWWPLEPDITYLNHGTVGVVPRRVLAKQQAIRDRIEQHPSRGMLREVVNMLAEPRDPSGWLRDAAAEVAAFVGAASSDLVFIENATTGVNTVLRSIPWAAGDELVLTDHAYGAVAYAAHHITSQHGAVVRTIPMPYPVFDRDELVRRVEGSLSPRTRLLLIDHVTSESALILPLREIAAVAAARGVPVLVDAAHAPGVVPIDLATPGVTWYTANLHKWAHAPRSAAFLWVARDHQRDLHPLVISWNLGTGFTAEFDWVGTRDPSSYLAAPEGLAMLRELGQPARDYMHDLAWRGARALCDRWGTTLGRDEASVGAMVTMPLPEAFGRTRADAVRLRDALLFEDGIEVALHAGYDRLWLRICAQVYNEWADIERLGDAVARRIPR